MNFFNFSRCILYFLCIFYVQGGFQEKILQLTNNRGVRDCGLYGPAKASATHHPAVVSYYNIGIFLILILMGIMLLLIIAGLIKGIIGIVCFPPVGMWGLGVLIDLPRPLNHYQERSLERIPVEYDMIGWPIHPETKQRTVRALTKRSEFCLNIIFFLTYPMIMCLDIITLCCFKTYDHDNDKDKCFEGVNTIVFTNCAGKKKLISKETGKKPSKLIYKDEHDTEEEEDTKYVLNEMQKSQELLTNQEYY